MKIDIYKNGLYCKVDFISCMKINKMDSGMVHSYGINHSIPSLIPRLGKDRSYFVSLPSL